MNTKTIWIIVGVLVLLIILYLVFGSSKAKASVPIKTGSGSANINTQPTATNSVAQILSAASSYFNGSGSFFGRSNTVSANAPAANQYCDSNGNPISPPCDSNGLDANGFLCCV